MTGCGGSEITYMPDRVSNVTCAPDFGSMTLVRGLARGLTETVESINEWHNPLTFTSGASQKIAEPEKFR